MKRESGERRDQDPETESLSGFEAGWLAAIPAGQVIAGGAFFWTGKSAAAPVPPRPDWVAIPAARNTKPLQRQIQP